MNMLKRDIDLCEAFSAAIHAVKRAVEAYFGFPTLIPQLRFNYIQRI